MTRFFDYMAITNPSIASLFVQLTGSVAFCEKRFWLNDWSMLALFGGAVQSASWLCLPLFLVCRGGRDRRRWNSKLPIGWFALVACWSNCRAETPDLNCWINGRTFEDCCLGDVDKSEKCWAAQSWHEGSGEFSFTRCCSWEKQFQISIPFSRLATELTLNRTGELFGPTSWGLMIVRDVPSLHNAVGRLLEARMRILELLGNHDEEINCDSNSRMKPVNHPRSDAVESAGCSVLWQRDRLGHEKNSPGFLFPVAVRRPPQRNANKTAQRRPAFFPDADLELYDASLQVTKILNPVLEHVTRAVDRLLIEAGKPALAGAFKRKSDYLHLNQVIYPGLADGGRPWGEYLTSDLHSMPADVRWATDRSKPGGEQLTVGKLLHSPVYWHLLQEWHHDSHWITAQTPPILLEEKTGIAYNFISELRDGVFLMDPEGKMQRFYLGQGDAAVWFGKAFSEATDGLIRAMPHTVLLWSGAKRNWKSGWSRHSVQVHGYPVFGSAAGEADSIPLPCMRYCPNTRRFPWKYGVRVDVKMRGGDTPW
eukprot:TRINITY_DN61620_c0_g1_i1.p1 TRINITY_DN61620_c0_g1~~TRINITY_DN61620_c0_g1_i1.p1  ORF type:complete len:537 (+),score=47.27 TRINITY_DN61620_c0_g1_i1:105-1715(+)